MTNDTPVTPLPGQRLTSLDTYRGFVMFLMVAEVLHLARVYKFFPDSAFWRFLAYHQTHVEWVGCSLHDLNQPSFTFMVGVALPFSIASRAAKVEVEHAKGIHHLVEGPWERLVLSLDRLDRIDRIADL